MMKKMKVLLVVATLLLFFCQISCKEIEPPVPVAVAPEKSSPKQEETYRSLLAAVEDAGGAKYIKTHEIDDEVRRGLEAAPPSSFQFPCDVPPNAKLQLVYGIAERDWRKAAADIIFTAHVRGPDGVVKRLFQKVPSDSDVRKKPWLKSNVSLSEYEGQKVDIILQVVSRLINPNISPTPFEGIPVWAQAAVESDDKSPDAGGPNFLWVTIDTLRVDHLSCYGYRRGTTPYIDGLAARGILFEQAIAQSPWTRPSVSSMLYSAYPHQICTHNCFGDRFVIEPELPNIQKVLGDEGYQTVGVVNNVTLAYDYGCGRDFNVYFQVKNDGDIYNEFVKWLKPRKKSAPFFAYLHLLGAHGPYNFVRGVTDNFIDSQQASTIERRFYGRHKLYNVKKKSPEELQGIIDLYDGEILASDNLVEKLITHLETMGLMQNTIVIITSDHGEEFGEHGEWDHGHSLYDELLRVPLILVRPGDNNGRRIKKQVSLIDIAPTIAQLADVTPPDTFVGRSLLGENAKASAPAFSEHMLYGRDKSSVRTPRIKYIFAPEGRSQEIYNLAKDPQEKKNLSSKSKWQNMAYEVLRDFHRLGLGASSETVVTLLFESESPKDWKIGFESDVSATPVLGGSEDKNIVWRQSKDFTKGNLAFQTQSGKSMKLMFTLQNSMKLLKTGISVDGAGLQEKELIVAGLKLGSPLGVLNNLADPNIRESLASPGPPELPQGLDASVRAWISSAESGMKKRDNEEHLKRMKTLGYL